MGNQNGTKNRTWSIVLAGGDGTRLTPLIQRWLGTARPKQYCAFVGTRSMFQHTLARAEQLANPDCTVTVIGKSHREFALSQLEHHSSGTVLLQPLNRDTAPGIFLPLTYIRARDPKATVVIYPSDHFIYPEGPFIDTVEHAIATTSQIPKHLLLLGIPPDNLELQYGWIRPGETLCNMNGYQIRKVQAFLEKPSLVQASTARAAGALWNTFVMAGKVETLWELGWQFLPKMMTLFERLSRTIGTSKEGAMLDAIYQDMPVQNFSSDLLQKATDRMAVIKVSNVLWSDWGHPQRVVSTLRQIGKSPAFPTELVEA